MKKLLAFILTLLMCLSLFACADDNGAESGDASTYKTESAESIESADASSDDSFDESSEDEKEVIAFEKFDENGDYIPTNFEYMKLMKVTQWDLSDGYFNKNEEMFRKEVARLMENISLDGFNTVLFQVRPFADSFYESEFYPLSYFVSGSYSNQSVDYDAVQIFVEEAHKAGLAIHGWINPMRCMTVDQIEQITGEWKITEWYSHLGDGGKYSDYMFKSTDAGGTDRLYLNVGHDEVKQLIVDGIDEILRKYNVDGIFMDDYFYPEAVKYDKTIDAQSFANRTDGSFSQDRYRRNNINALVQSIYKTVKTHGEEYIYGISPNGDISHAYSAECADIYTWCANEGYVDVMYPQFYYGMMHGQCSISELMKQWTNVLTNKNIKLVPVLTLHKAGNADQWAVTPVGKSEWQTYDDVVLESLTYMLLNEYRIPDGMGFFCYQYFHGGSKTAAVSAELDAFMPLWMQYDKFVGMDKAALVEAFDGIGYNLKELGDKWDAQLSATEGFKALFMIP